jgi:CRISPR-associated endonuclease Cas3-HD
LSSHTKGVTERALRYASRDYLEICRRRLRSTNVDCDVQEIKKIIALSAILHDVGKAADKYQQQFDDKCFLQNNYTKPTFYLHEVFSAVIAKRISEHNRIALPSSFFIVSSVLQHLHTMRSIDRKSTVYNSIRKLSEEKKYCSISSTSKLLEMVNSICKEYGLDINVEASLFGNFTPEEAQSMFRWLHDVIENRNYKWPKLYVLFLNPIVIGDNLDAEENRTHSAESGNRTPFMKELAITLGY